MGAATRRGVDSDFRSVAYVKTLVLDDGYCLMCILYNPDCCKYKHKLWFKCMYVCIVKWHCR